MTAAAVLALGLSASPAHAGDLTAAIQVANAVYPSVPQRCGAVELEDGPLTAENEANGAMAEAREPECLVVIKPGIVTSFSDARLCSLLTHEWGHLAGRRFPENASDPRHSSDPADNMYGPALVHHPACGESDDARTARRAHEHAMRIAQQGSAASRDQRRANIEDELGELKDKLRAAKAAKRRSNGARRARREKRIKRLQARIRNLRAEYRALAPAPLL